MTLPALHRLAAAAGVAVQWTDAFGAPQVVKDDSLCAVLKSLAIETGSDQQCLASIRQLAAEENHGSLPPLVTGHAGEPVSLPGSWLKNGQHYIVDLEHGGTVTGTLQEHAGRLHTAALLQPGYHRFRSGHIDITIAAAPRRCFGVTDALQRSRVPAGSKLWGIAAQLYSLRRGGDGGLGDFTALASLARAAASQGASAVAISPVHAMFSAEPARFSPYAPSSRLFFNVLHVDPSQVLGKDACRTAMHGLAGASEIARLESSSMVDWPGVSNLRLALLRRMHEQFCKGIGPETTRGAFADFCQRGGKALFDHACFEALDTWLRDHPEVHPDDTQGDWRAWPAEYRKPGRAEVVNFASAHRQEVEFHQFVQWLAASGLENAQAAARSSGMAIGIVADLAVGADPGGSQAWGLQSAMLSGVTVGAPPDLLSAQGQNWGVGALSPLAMRRQGFDAWIGMLRANMRHCGGIRIDHVLGMKRLWLVPEGMPASEGAYVSYPFDDLLRLTALESQRHGAIVIGEDLGTVPAGFSEEISAAGMLGIRALWFQRDGPAFLPPHAWPANAMATTSTHDLVTTKGWWAGRDLQWRKKLGPPEESGGSATAAAEREAEKRALWSAITHQPGCQDGPPEKAPISEMLQFVGATPAALVMVPLEDALGILDQPNLPGTIDEHPNWRQRLPDDADRMLNLEEVRERLAGLESSRRNRGDGLPAEVPSIAQTEPSP